MKWSNTAQIATPLALNIKCIFDAANGYSERKNSLIEPESP
jgi:hypothetical protein